MFKINDYVEFKYNDVIHGVGTIISIENKYETDWFIVKIEICHIKPNHHITRGRFSEQYLKLRDVNCPKYLK